MSLSDEQAAFLLDVCKLIQFATDQGCKVTGGELQRMIEQQRHYLAMGRSETLESSHLEKLAIDLNFFKTIPPMTKEVYINGLEHKTAFDMLKPIGEYWEGLNRNNKWGGFWKTIKDVPHFQRDL